MFIPIRTDRRQQRTPWVTYGLLGLNVAIFLATARGGVGAVEAGLLVPTAPKWWQFVSYAFLHADIFHLGGNMLFLYVFGRPLEDRFRHVGFLAFYLAAGVLAGLGHCLTDSAPVLGASGAVAGVTGAFLALFPLSRITVVYWFIFVGAFEIAGLYLIVLQIFMNLFGLAGGGAGVAYTAHLAGYAVGFLVG
ncbi:MAG: rhomboid family intramembrane serine protease, partial [Phycisphaeraceae bacterium]|nr:rhomboid family intramembrane serine protease [Phycisphaeraceae bacterium]